MKTRSQTLVLLFCMLPFASALAAADGNVAVSVRRGSLKVQGGRATSQMVRISPTAVPNQLRIEANSTTTLNGVNPLIVDGVTGGIDVRLSASESLLILTENTQPDFPVHGNLSVSLTGRGFGFVLLDTVLVEANLAITTGNGEDAVLLGRCSGQGEVSVRSGGNNDAFYSFQSGCSVLDVDMGSGNDFLLMTESVASIADLCAGGGNDYLGTNEGYLGRNSFDGGLGLDQLLHEAVTFVSPPAIRRIESDFAGTVEELFTLAYNTNPAYEQAFLIWLFSGLED